MTCETTYMSPFGPMVMRSDGQYLTQLFFADHADATVCGCTHTTISRLPVFEQTARWLDIYFNGHNPDFTPDYRMNHLTPFRRKVVDLMLQIPYGQTVTYNELAQTIAAGTSKMSAQAVGGAVGWNPICIVVPCHRVVGAHGNLTGYGGGIDNKVRLLELEGNDMSRFYMPTKMQKEKR